MYSTFVLLRNEDFLFDLPSIIFLCRFGRSSMYHKKAVYKFVKKGKKVAPQKKAVFVEKKVKGDKNGGTR